MPKSIFWAIKKSRPTNPPESYLSRVYIQSEQLFEFGPLLVGKTDRPSNKNINSSVFRISNSGKFDSEIQFQLLSSVMENDAAYKKGVF